MKIYLISTYPPRTCGIATFSQNLFHSIAKQEKGRSSNMEAKVVALVDSQNGIEYPSQVELTLQVDSLPSYTKVGEYLNRNADMIILQHEYGIYGGQDGAYLLTLLKTLQCPILVTLHTVLKEPSQGQKFVIQEIGRLAGGIVVMSQLAKKFLEEIYRVPAEKIRIIEHGVPDIPLANREGLRKKLGYEGKKILFTFGLLGRGKGVETAIAALPSIVDKHPDTLYVVLGKTHPANVRENGEEYREHLLELAKQKGVSDNVCFIDSFASEEELWEYLQACDVYVVPYLNEAQITSGTLSYAIGAGAAVVSTPFWHAQELLSEGRGRTFDFCNVDQLSNIINELFDSPELIKDLQEKASSYGKHLKWSFAGKHYLTLIKNLKNRSNSSIPSGHARAEVQAKQPPLTFKHLQTLTDPTGIIQHAKFAIPNRFEGYCIDDNARALIAVVMASRRHPDAWLSQAATIYMGFIYHCQNEDGTFHNFMSYERQFLDERGSEDSFGRTIWALGYTISHSKENDVTLLAHEIFGKAVPNIINLTSPRSMAFSIMGLYHYLKKRPNNENLLGLMHQLRLRLCEFYNAKKENGWEWFEDKLTYCNGVLPLALLYSLELMPDDKVQTIALETTAFLKKLTIENGICQPIGSEGFYPKNGKRAYYDQQPVDVMVKVLLFLQANKITGDKQFLQNARVCYDWFLGKNSLHLPMYDKNTGGCCDGLTPVGVNRNQGAESTLAYLITRLVWEEHVGQEQSQQTHGKKIKHQPNTTVERNFVFNEKRAIYSQNGNHPAIIKLNGGG